MKKADPALLPGLTNALALHCLARVPRENFTSLRGVSKLWQGALVSKELYALRKKIGFQEPWVYVAFFCQDKDAGSKLASRSWIEAYNPQHNQWHFAGAIPGLEDTEFLRDFALVSVGEKLFVIGGRICSVVSGGEVRVSHEVRCLNCVTGKWSQCAAMSMPRVDFACTVSGDFIYVAGGRTSTFEGGIPYAEVYSPADNAWAPLPAMTIGRFKCAGVAMDGQIYVVGGFAGSCHAYDLGRSSVDAFDPATWNWRVLPGMWQVDIPPNQVVAMQGRLYGSGDVLNPWKGRLEVYDGMLNAWKIVEGSRRTKLLQSGDQRYLTMVPIGETSLIFVGGYNVRQDYCVDLEEEEEERAVMAAVSVFDIHSHQWYDFEPLPSVCKELAAHCSVVAL